MGVREQIRGWGSLFVLASASALRGVRDNLRTVVWQPFAISLGLDMQQIGSLESLSDLVKLLLEPAFGVISDSLGRKRLLIIREAVALGAIILLLFARSWGYLFLSMLLVGVAYSLVSVWSTLIAEVAPPGRLGFIYSLMSASYTGAGLVGTLASGYIEEAFGYGAVYIVASVVAFASLALVWFRLPETRKDAPTRVEAGKTISSYIRALNPPKELRGFYVAMGLDLLAFSMGMRLMAGMLNSEYHYTPWMIALYTTAMTITQAGFQIPLGRLADRFGYGRFLAISQFLASVALATMIWSKDLPVIVAANLLFGFANAFWIPAEQAWIADNVDPKQRAQSLGSYSTFRGLIGLPAPIVGGVLFDAFGFNVPMFANLALAFIDGVVILIWVKDRRR